MTFHSTQESDYAASSCVKGQQGPVMAILELAYPPYPSQVFQDFRCQNQHAQFAWQSTFDSTPQTEDGIH